MAVPESREFDLFMQLFWHGYSSVRIESKIGDQEATLLTDPYENEAGLRFPRTVAPDILLLSNQDRKKFNLEGVQGEPFVISDPGEYEVKGLHVHAIQDPAVDAGTRFRPVIFRCVIEGMSVAFLGQLKRKLTPFELEELDDVDVLLLPVGGGDVMDSKIASETIAEIEPRMIVPLHFDLPGIKTPLGTVDAFCKALGVCKRQDANKLKITKKDLPAEDLLVTVLERA
jgi:L-ascorbate metabolism protein UlaG (beta-lactamase superfamily)